MIEEVEEKEKKGEENDMLEQEMLMDSDTTIS